MESQGECGKISNLSFGFQSHQSLDREAAYAMATYIRPPENVQFDPPFFDAEAHGRYTMIELGSGSGLVASIIASCLKAGRDLLIATDLLEVGVFNLFSSYIFDAEML